MGATRVHFAPRYGGAASKLDKPRPVVLFEVVKGMVTGTPPGVGAQRHLPGGQVKGAPGVDERG